MPKLKFSKPKTPSLKVSHLSKFRPTKPIQTINLIIKTKGRAIM